MDQEHPFVDHGALPASSSSSVYTKHDHQPSQDVASRLSDNAAAQSNEETEPYCAFSTKQQLAILFITAASGMLSPLSANIYFPAVNRIQEDLHTTSELVNLTITVYMVFQGLSPAFWGSLADLWGRRPVYMLTVFIYCLSCIGLALTDVYGLLLFFRMVQAFGASSLIAIGAGVIGDITAPEKRGGFYGIFSMGQLMGPVIGPLIGGLVAGTISWRWIFLILLMLAAATFVLILFFLPETLRSLVGNGSGYANPTPFQWLQRRRQACLQEKKLPSTTITVRQRSRFLRKPAFLAPFLYILQMDVFIGLVYVGLLYSTYYCYLVTTTRLFSTYYGLTTIQIGLCFIPSGLGCVIGSYAAGRMLDRDYRVVLNHYKQDHPEAVLIPGVVPLDFPIYHARLRTSIIFVILAQLITVVYGWVIHQNAHLAIPIILQFIVAFCMVSLMNGIQTLLVDLFPGRGASITASNNLIRCILGAVVTVCTDPGITGVGVGWFFTIIGLIMLTSNVFYVILLGMGSKYRVKRHGQEDAEKAPEAKA